MRKQWRYFLLALGFFTRMPVPNKPDFEQQELNQAVRFFPLIGILVGLAAALVFYLAGFLLPHSLAVLISMAATIYLTGAFHEDGLADSADALGGGWDQVRILAIMQDSRLGTFGVVTIAMALLAKFQALNAIPAMLIPVALISAHALSRLSAIWLMRSLDYVKFEGKAKPLATKVSFANFAIAHIFGLLPYVGFIVFLFLRSHSPEVAVHFLLLTMLPVLVIAYWWRQKIQRWIGGYTGDALGAMQQMTELAFYLGFVAWSVHL